MKSLLRGIAILGLLLLSQGQTGWADEEVVTPQEPKAVTSPKGSESAPIIESVDIPTAEILDPMTYSLTFRFYNEGGVLSRFILGPMKRVNLGISFDSQRVIGSSDPHMIRPSVFFKFRFFDGTDFLPALAAGYDNQGYLYQEDIRQFLHREKGLYLVGSHEILLPDMELHAGINDYDFDNSNSKPFGFFGLTFKITKNFAILSDYDNLNNFADARFNMGGRYWVAPYFNVDFAARNIGHGTDKGGERIIRLNYVGNFPI